jgi:hypothetical protein
MGELSLSMGIFPSDHFQTVQAHPQNYGLAAPKARILSGNSDGHYTLQDFEEGCLDFTLFKFYSVN